MLSNKITLNQFPFFHCLFLIEAAVSSKQTCFSSPSSTIWQLLLLILAVKPVMADCVQHIHWSAQEPETCALQVQINRSSRSTGQSEFTIAEVGTPRLSALLLRALVCLKSIKSLLCSAAFHPRKMKSGYVYKKIKRRVTLWEPSLFVRSVWDFFWVFCWMQTSF